MLPVQARMAFGAISVVPMSVAVPVRRSAPVAAGPHPVVVAPSPTAAHPDVARHRANGCHLYYRGRHRRRHDDWRRGDNRGRNRESEVDTEANPGVYRGDSNSNEG